MDHQRGGCFCFCTFGYILVNEYTTPITTLALVLQRDFFKFVTNSTRRQQRFEKKRETAFPYHTVVLFSIVPLEAIYILKNTIFDGSGRYYIDKLLLEGQYGFVPDRGTRSIVNGCSFCTDLFFLKKW